jgi:hypothetical protein
MPRSIVRIRGIFRALRGRCPSCGSQPSQRCNVCLGYRMPFPASASTRQRWWFRFEQQLAAQAARAGSPSLGHAMSGSGSRAGGIAAG